MTYSINGNLPLYQSNIVRAAALLMEVEITVDNVVMRLRGEDDTTVTVSHEWWSKRGSDILELHQSDSKVMIVDYGDYLSFCPADKFHPNNSAVVPTGDIELNAGDSISKQDYQLSPIIVADILSRPPGDMIDDVEVVNGRRMLNIGSDVPVQPQYDANIGIAVMLEDEEPVNTDPDLAEYVVVKLEDLPDATQDELKEHAFTALSDGSNISIFMNVELDETEDDDDGLVEDYSAPDIEIEYTGVPVQPISDTLNPVDISLKAKGTTTIPVDDRVEVRDDSTSTTLVGEKGIPGEIGISDKGLTNDGN